MNMVQQMDDVLTSLSVDARCVNAERHGHLAFFDVKLQDGARVRKLELFSREIGLGLRSKTEPIITPRLSDGVVRFRFAMDDAETIHFHKYYEKCSSDAPDGLLPFLLGKNDEGKPMWLDMAKNPHMLVAGATGSGKSVFLQVLIANALQRDDVDLMLVDPKFGVEFGRYEGCAEVAKDYDEALEFLRTLEETMNNRYRKMAKWGITSIEHRPDVFRKKLMIVDEVADLMIYDSHKRNPNKGQFEDLLCSIAQKARACGIYLVVATQRPSVDVITGTIKTNFPARVAFEVAQSIDSKVILDRVGAESLLGKGDAIMVKGKTDVRFQSAFVDLDTV